MYMSAQILYMISAKKQKTSRQDPFVIPYFAVSEQGSLLLVKKCNTVRKTAFTRLTHLDKIKPVMSYNPSFIKFKK